MQKAAVRFPDDERWLLPTSFGNTVRAFEVYSRIMYGMDAIVGWNRLLAVVPVDYRSLIDDAKTYVDFWANVWFFGIVVFMEYVALAWHTHQRPLLWIPFIALLASTVAFFRAQTSAIEWGDFVKSAFDTYLVDLRKKLAFPLPKNRDEEKDMWLAFSRSVLYINPDRMPSRDLSQQQGDKD